MNTSDPANNINADKNVPLMVSEGWRSGQAVPPVTK